MHEALGKEAPGQEASVQDAPERNLRAESSVTGNLSARSFGVESLSAGSFRIGSLSAACSGAGSPGTASLKIKLPHKKCPDPNFASMRFPNPGDPYSNGYVWQMYERNEAELLIERHSWNVIPWNVTPWYRASEIPLPLPHHLLYGCSDPEALPNPD